MIHPAGGSVAFDRAAGYYDETRGLPPAVAERVADRIEAAAGPAARLLEIGVGTGRVALPLHRRGRQLLGVDLSGPMLQRYRAKAAALGLRPPPLLRADATRLPLRDASVDAVLEVHVLHLIPTWRAALAEVRRVLAPGGLVLIGRGGHREADGPRNQTLRRFERLAQEAGGGPPRLGAVDVPSRVAELVALGGTAEVLEPVVWEGHDSYARALELVERRSFSYMWRLPDEVWRAASNRLRAELEAAYPDLDAPRPARHAFTLTAVRFPAG
ncbi:MAG TPA: methyltransferase domain-containing protein [Actinomycetes bacterium]|nr:methyltransferase domain-containing protein [Actinomycetes bacterium]